MQQKARIHFPVIAKFLPLAFLLCLTGCLYTGPMWRDANARFVAEPRTFGIIEPGAGTNETSEHGPRLLVIRYSINEHEELYATIPVTAEGCPVEPFCYVGDKRSGCQIVDELPESQRQRLRETRLTFHDERWAEDLRADTRFRELGWKTDGMSVPHDDLYDRSDWALRKRGRVADVRVRALRLGRPWTDIESAAMPLPVESPIVYPTNACILVLPYAQPRPERHRHMAQARAMLLTPVTLVGDVVITPLIYIGCYGLGQCP